MATTTGGLRQRPEPAAEMDTSPASPPAAPELAPAAGEALGAAHADARFAPPANAARQKHPAARETERNTRMTYRLDQHRTHRPSAGPDCVRFAGGGEAGRPPSSSGVVSVETMRLPDQSEIVVCSRPCSVARVGLCAKELSLSSWVGVVGFEPTTAGTQSRPSTRLRYTPKGGGL
jgi:hypothetical protein